MIVIKEITIALAVILSFGIAQAQHCDSVNLGTKTLYTAPVKAFTHTPAGYQPVFINYVSRHGARHLTKPVSTSFSYTILQKADNLNGLSEEGKRLLILLKKLEAVEKGNIKNISAEGIHEQQAIAKRMYEQNTTLFLQPIQHWKAAVTKEIRTRQTAQAFIEALQKQVGKQDSVFYMINDTTLRFFDLSPTYLKFEKTGSWKEDVTQLKYSLQFQPTVVQESISRWLTAKFAHTLSATDQEELVTDIYGFYSILPSIQNEATEQGIAINEDSIGQFFNCSSLEKLSRADAVEDYLSKGPGRNANGIQVKIAAPLLADFINTTDAFIQQATTPVTLRFCHAETIAPFTALLQLDGADKPVDNINSFTTQVWNAATVVPLSANVQWVLYKSKASNHYLLKCLLNERETKIDGLATKQFPYYDWQSVRAFYLNKLQQLQFDLTSNGYQYLQKLL